MAVEPGSCAASGSRGAKSSSGGGERGAFLKYEKMGEDSGSVGAVAGVAPGCADAYVVTEKVHGANFCIIASFVDEEEVERPGLRRIDVRFAKRTAVLGRAEDAEDFFSCRSSGLLRALQPRAQAALRLLAERSTRSEGATTAQRRPGSLVAVHIYGELFGGAYPHPEVAPVPGMEPVQVGVWYAPDLRFMAFDLAVEEEEPGGSGVVQRYYLNFDTAREACESVGLLFAQPLAEGSLAECLDYPVEFVTTLPARLGLPPLPAGAEPNLAEGVVVRPRREPLQSRSGGSGGRGKESLRGLFKRKIPTFSESRYQHDDWKRGKAGGGGFGLPVSEEELARMEITALVTEQRLANVLSKTGRVDPSDKVAMRQLLQDLKEDVREALGESDEAAVLQGSPALQAELDQLCRELITQAMKAEIRRRKKEPSAESAGGPSAMAA